MRILICMTLHCPWSQSIAVTLQTMGFDVHAVDFAENPGGTLVDVHNPGIVEDFDEFRTKISGIHYLRPRTRGKIRYLEAAPMLARLARTVGAEVLLTLYAGGFGLMAFLSGFRPYAVYVVGSDVLRVNRFFRGLNRLIFTSAAQVFANGEYLAEVTRRQAPRANITPLLLGVDPTGFASCGDRAEPFQFLCARGFNEVYNNISILKAISRFPGDLPDYRFVFSSGGELLKERIAFADREIPPVHRKRVVFLKGVPYERLRREFCRSSAYVSMSRSDGTSTSVLEAMASGLFLVLSDIPQNRPWVVEGRGNGILVPLDDIDALSSALQRILRHPEACQNARVHNRNLVEQKADARVTRGILAERLAAIRRSRRRE